MNPRKPIYAMMVVGAAVILALTFAPYALMKDARRAAAADQHQRVNRFARVQSAFLPVRMFVSITVLIRAFHKA